ncbi:acyl-CoA dehydrogenase family protein [Geomicrobium sp. JCM 19038]|uniref:acyl-CoA dehydrogenase family protein n=1 Tax=Geomicrobium sp. JCM 19038 TaxID=1460635 RepID=UPI00045F4819|nr:acyl-CoA dehydrogenase family protein [Geomicrobium sp. JCM 19038]GAK08209.1 butyryl-CoA dehydrogenase [Geomicrobium sp. JCM 19038]
MLLEEQKMMKDVAKKIARDVVAKHAEEVDRLGEMPWENIRVLAENGLFGVHVPEEYGGAGSDMLSHVAVIEEIAGACASTSVALSTQALTMAPFLLAGTEEQKQKYIPRLAKGEVLGSFGITEPSSGSDVSSLTTTATKDGDDYLLNGQKVFITNAGESEIYVFVTRTSEDRTNGITLFIAEKGTEGLTFGNKEDKMGIRGSVTREVFLDNVRVPKENMLGEEGKGFKILMNVFNETRPVVGAQAVGIAKGAYDYAIDYVKNRKQFGKTLDNFQMIQAMAADMRMKIEAARLLVYQAATKLDQGEQDVALHSSMAKCFASDMAMSVTTDAVQLLGGYGFIKEYPVERMMRDAKITQIYEGTNQIQRVIIGNYIFKS